MKMGDRVVDVINGFEGIVTGRTDYINGCTQFLVCPEKLDKEGKLLESHWIDKQRLVFKTGGVVESASPATAGGPQEYEPAKV